MRTGFSLKFASSFLSATLVLFAVPASAQSYGFYRGGMVAPRGVPASVTSFGFGGHPGFHGVPASVTSQGFGTNFGINGVPAGVPTVGFGTHFPVHSRPFGFNHHGHSRFYTPFYGGYYVPYAYPYYAEDDYQPPEEPVAYDAHPTREEDDRQLLNDDYRAELNSVRSELNSLREQQSEPKAAPEPVTNQPNTVLIFKDGRQVEIANYAIVGSTLYELNDGRSTKVQLADLDLRATMKENDERGVEFELPAGAEFN
jgi:hypothetical protein